MHKDYSFQRLRAIRIGQQYQSVTPEEHFQIHNVALLFTKLWFVLKNWLTSS